MEVIEPPMAACPRTVLDGAVAALFDAVGRADFATRLLAAARCVSPVDYVSAFAFALPSLDRALLVGTDSAAGPLPASRAAAHYMSDFWRNDPNLDLVAGLPRAERRSLVTYLRRTEIPNLSYRAACYDQPAILDRLSLLVGTGSGHAVTVSFYRGRRHGEFSAAERTALGSMLPFVRAAALRHLELPGVVQPGALDDPRRVLPRVTARFPALTRREAEIAAGVLCGMTAAAIGAWLGIAASSVVTLRKRAYARLGVEGSRGLVVAFHGQ
jgi:DNA-binding CsgD family transcriptional regulator